MKKKKEIVLERQNPNFIEGLTHEQVEERKKLGYVNNTKQNSGKSILQILIDNICTFFNLIWVLVFVALLIVGAYGDLLFIIVILANTTIAIVQEIKAKFTVEKLSYISSPKLIAIRQGKEEKIPVKNICLDDVLKLSVGNQIPADSIILQGVVEVNESILTGESEPQKKQVGDVLLAGSFIISGACYVRVDKIGKDSYIQTVALQTKKFKSPASNLFKDINMLVKFIGVIILPLALLLFANNYFACGKVLDIAIAQTCGAITGMVPAGMFLLITVALSLGVIKLGKKKTLVQDIYSIEMLARTNVLCLDKTGTITDGTMRVCEHIDLKILNDINNKTAIANILNTQMSNNQTSSALLLYYKKSTELLVSSNIEFSSARKFTATSFEGVGTFAIGAPEFLHVGNLDQNLQDLIFQKATDGKRVLMLAYSKELMTKEELPYYMEPYALIVLEDHIREDAIGTIKWFKENDVEIKIISGDNPYTVSNIAKRVGVENAESCISLEGMSLVEVEKIADDFTVFGRVSPEQKHAIIKALKKSGNTVAMTGDGVNDTLALKEADCSIAMADGSEVARNLSNIVLLDSKFSSLPSVVKEGRQVINNVQRSSSLFLMKTIFTILLSLIAIITNTVYPFTPARLLLLEMFVIGIPSVILAIQPNDDLIKGDFIPSVLKKALPYAMLMLFNVVAVMTMYNFGFFDSVQTYYSLSTLVLIGTGYVNLVYLCKPFNALRLTCLGISAGCLLIAIIAFGKFFGITNISFNVFLAFVLLVGITIPLHIFVPKLSDYLFEKIKNSESTKRIVESQKLKQEQKQEKLQEKQQIKENKQQNKHISKSHKKFKRFSKGEIIISDVDEGQDE